MSSQLTGEKDFILYSTRPECFVMDEVWKLCDRICIGIGQYPWVVPVV
ncbi:MAG: hypothetical protein AAFQ74_05110 [Cyanobacteria bacterium J06623_4]